MKAVVVRQFGGPEVLRCETVPDPEAEAGQAIIAIRAASVNPSDIANVAGKFPETSLPRIPGRDYAGVVVDGPKDWVGAEIWGTGNLGYTADGSHAALLKVPVASLRRKPRALSHAEAASVGVTFLAAWIGISEYAGLQRGETLVVIGASGGVGSAAVQIGRWLGARVFGVDRSPPDPASPAVRAAERVIAPPLEESAAVVRALTDGRGANVVLNAVGGPTFEPSLNMLARGGRLAVLASPSQRRQTFDLVDFYHNESRLLGVDTLKRDVTAAAKILEKLAPGFEDGNLKPPPVRASMDLDRAVEAYQAAAKGGAGRVVLVPSAS